MINTRLGQRYWILDNGDDIEENDDDESIAANGAASDKGQAWSEWLGDERKRRWQCGGGGGVPIGHSSSQLHSRPSPLVRYNWRKNTNFTIIYSVICGALYFPSGTIAFPLEWFPCDICLTLVCSHEAGDFDNQEENVWAEWKWFSHQRSQQTRSPLADQQNNW